MTDEPTREQLLHLADRARRGVALPAEHDALNAGINTMADRMAKLEAEREKNDAINAVVDAKTEQQLNDATEVVQYFKALAGQWEARSEQETARANRYRARVDAAKAVLAPYDWPHAQVRAAAVRAALAPQQQQPTL
ncbi:hypothetical protein [Streptomyces sp. 900116325]